ncbi:MAG TPA: hypothetical protein VI216_11640 [Candidatus Acidoferrales bacterium]
MLANFATGSPESSLPVETPSSIPEDQPDSESTMLIEVDTANPSPTTIAIAEAIAYILSIRDRYIEPEPAPKRRRRRQVRSSQPLATSQSQPARSHHTRHCTICHHPERQAIEEEFIGWHSPKGIAQSYAVGARSVYRHARALGLFERRASRLRDALGHIIEKVQSVSVTADAVVRAVYAHSHLSSSGQWIEHAPPVVSPNPSPSSELIDTPVE